jgi:hypothetical protein
VDCARTSAAPTSSYVADTTTGSILEYTHGTATFMLWARHLAPASRLPLRSSAGVWPAIRPGLRHGDRLYGRPAWLGFLVFASSMVVMFPDDGTFGRDVLIGWPNRFMMLAYSAWLMVVAWRAARLSRQRS